MWNIVLHKAMWTRILSSTFYQFYWGYIILCMAIHGNTQCN